MSLSVFDISIPALTRGLDNLSALLDKAVVHAEARKFDSAVLAHTRLFPDMLPLSSQVQIACDTAKGAAARLAQRENPKHADTEVSLAELKARIAKTLEFLKSVTPAEMEGAAGREVELKFPSGPVHFTGAAYLTKFVLPNFYFHIGMAYALLRSNGVDLGKSDYLGAVANA